MAQLGPWKGTKVNHWEKIQQWIEIKQREEVNGFEYPRTARLVQVWWFSWLCLFQYRLPECFPFFSYAEITGNRFGAPTSQSVLKESKIGLVLNGKFYTWHAARTIYDNGYEAGFGVPNELLLQLLTNVNSLAYVTPLGESIPLQTTNFQQSLQAAIDICRKRLK